MSQERPMPQAPVTPIEAQLHTAAPQAEDQQNRWQLMRKSTIVASTLASLALINAGPKVEVPNPFDQGDPVTETVPGKSQPTEIVVGGKSHEVIIKQNVEPIDSAGELWAKLFSADSQAGKLTGLGELTKVRDRVDGLRDRGFTITRVGLEGHASDEDASVDSEGQRTGGLQERSKENRQLANKRARVFRALVGEDLAVHGESVPPIEITNPVEDMLTNQEVADVEALAHKYGYGQVVTMIEDYNRGEGVSKEVQESLDQLLAKERKVVVTIDAERPAIFEEGVPTIDLIPGNTPGTTETSPGDDGKIPLALPLFMFIPLMRRRSSSGETTDKPPTNPPIVPPLPPRRPPGKTTEGQTEVPVEPIKLNARGRRDEQFKEQAKVLERTAKVAIRRKQPRPHNMHGHTGRNSHHVRDRGGSRPATRRTRGPRK